MLAQARSPQNSPDAPSKEKEAEQKTLVGTGFFVSQNRQVLTNAHVVDGCSTVTIGVGSEESITATATVTARDSTNDLALIRTGLQPLNYASFRANARLGDSVGAFGYPLREILSPKGNFTRGHITGITGLFDDAKFLQMSAPIQLGNSGGPLVDDSGNVVGVVTKKLDAIRMAAITRDLAQHVNFAIKAELAATFLASNRVSYSTGSRQDQLRPDDLADHARSISVALSCSPPLSARQN